MGLLKTKEQYREYVKTVLEANEGSDSSVDSGNGVIQSKFFGMDNSFSGMSKKVGKQWKQADAVIRSVFRDLAKEENERAKKVSGLIDIIQTRSRT